MSVEAHGSAERERGRWWGLWTLVAFVIVGFIVVESIQGLAHDTDPNKWGWGSALLVGLVGAFSLVRNLMGLGRPRIDAPGAFERWQTVLAFAFLFVAIATKALASGGSVLDGFLAGSVYFAIIGFGALGMHIYNRND